MRRLFFALLIAASPFLRAEETAMYNFIDLLDESQNTFELWTSEQDEREDGDHAITFRTITKRPFAKRKEETEKQTWWYNEKRQKGDTTYSREVFRKDIQFMRPGDRSYGSLEERDTATEKIIRNWPMFYTVEEDGGTLRATFDIYFDAGVRMQIVRNYHKKDYYFPLQESRKLFLESIVILHTVHKRAQ